MILNSYANRRAVLMRDVIDVVVGGRSSVRRFILRHVEMYSVLQF